MVGEPGTGSAVFTKDTEHRKSDVKYSAAASSANLIGFKASYENLPAAQLSPALKKWLVHICRSFCFNCVLTSSVKINSNVTLKTSVCFFLCGRGDLDFKH